MKSSYKKINKYENGDSPTQKYTRDLGRVVSLTTMRSWIQMLKAPPLQNLSQPRKAQTD